MFQRDPAIREKIKNDASLRDSLTDAYRLCKFIS